MEEVLKYVTLKQYNKEYNDLKNGQDKIIYVDDKIKITLKKRGKKVYTFIDRFKNTNNINNILKNIVNLV